MWVPFSRPFPGDEAHKLLSGGGLGGGQKVYVEKVDGFFPCLDNLSATSRPRV